MTETASGGPVASTVHAGQPHPVGYVQGREFYVKFTGMELRNFSDVPIKVAGLINTSTHKLAIETDPQWTMVIRHVGSWRVKTRPKCRLYPCGRQTYRQAPAICFAMPACYRFNTLEQAFEWMKLCDFQLSPHNLDLRAVHKREADVRASLRAEVEREYSEKWYRERCEEIRSDVATLLSQDEAFVFDALARLTEQRRSKLPRPKRCQPDMTNVLSFEDMRARIERILAEHDAIDEDYRQSLAS